MAPPLLTLQNIGLTFGGAPLLDDAELVVTPGERACLVGRNGSGKSTLLKVAAGLIEPDRGSRFVQPGATVRYLPQEPDLTGFATTLAYVEAGLGPGDDPYRARYLLNELSLTGEERPECLSGGEARRAALARLLAPEPDILLLDEPTNHLARPAIEWLEAELKKLRSALVLISHDRRFLEILARATIWLDRGVTRRLDQGFAGFEAWRDAWFEQEERERHKLDRKIAAEADWLRYGVTARRKRNVRRLAALKTMRQEHRNQRRAVGDLRMSAQDADLSGKLVIEAERIGKRFGETVLVQDFSTRILRGDRVGIVGPNGVGKTTLLNLLTGALAPDSGTVRLGANLQPVTLDQRRESLDPDWTVAEALTGGRGDTVAVAGQSSHVVGYMKDFLCAPEQARMPLRVLSGGERGRLMLARALAKPSNLLVLDEPTNDLDLETLDLLEELLADYAGTVLLISHDRDFLDRIVTTTIVAEGEGRWIEYAGGYTDMVAQRGSGITAKTPERPLQSNERPAAPNQPEPALRKRKLTFNEKNALETMPVRIVALESEVARLQTALADPGLYAWNATLFETTSSALARAQRELAEAEDRWLGLELLREELGA